MGNSYRKTSSISYASRLNGKIRSRVKGKGRTDKKLTEEELENLRKIVSLQQEAIQKLCVQIDQLKTATERK